MKLVTRVEIGQVVRMKLPPNRRVIDVVVAPPCDDKKSGEWYCITHGEAFSSRLMKDFHIGKGAHVLAWLCQHHGPEQP